MNRRPAERVRERLVVEGALPFAAVMHEALYGAGGYYAREVVPIGESGDFVTGSSLSPLFGRATARLLGRLDEALGRVSDYLEAGFGNGEHLRHLIAADRASGSARRILAHDAVVRPLPPGAVRADALADLAGSIEGLVFSYELFDALPIHRLVGRSDGTVAELWVELDGADGLKWSERPLSDPSLAALLGDPGDARALAPGQVADLAPGWEPLYRILARTLRRGLLVTCDYGFERPQLLDRRIRGNGTLACYRSQRVHRDALRDLGEQDLTAHVDFTRLREAGEAEGLTTIAFTRQARWLLACGLFDELRDAPVATRLEAMRLLDGEGMGEEIRVLVQARDCEATESLLDVALMC